MRKKEKYYLVEFKIYHYNSGMADNGTFTHRIKCKTLEEANEIKKKINLVYNTDDCDYNDLSDELQEWIGELIGDYTAVGGYIASKARVIARYDVIIEININ